MHFLEDGNLDAREENNLVAYAEYFKVTQDDLNKRLAIVGRCRV